MIMNDRSADDPIQDALKAAMIAAGVSPTTPVDPITSWNVEYQDEQERLDEELLLPVEDVAPSAVDFHTVVTDSRLEIPAINPFIITRTNNLFLRTVDAISLKGGNINVLITGKHGTGKSELARQYAATRNRPYAQLDCGGLTEAFQIFGKMTLEGNHTVYQRGLFTDAVETPNAVIHLQELNRAESDRALNALFSLLDKTSRSIWVEELGARVTVAPGVTFFATLNEGYQYIGTMPLDEALRNRFSIKMQVDTLPSSHERRLLELRYGLPAEQEEDLIAMVERIRDQGTTEDSYISTRDLMAMGELIQAGLTTRLALFAVLGTTISNLENILIADHFAGNITEVLDQSYEALS